MNFFLSSKIKCLKKFLPVDDLTLGRAVVLLMLYLLQNLSTCNTCHCERESDEYYNYQIYIKILCIPVE